MMTYAKGCAAAALAFVLACTPKPDPQRLKLMSHLHDGRAAARVIAIQQLALHANKEETTAIVRAAQDGPVDVRVAVATALAKVDADNAVDLAGGFLRDPSDEVRAAAVKTLVARGGPRAHSYIAHAYVSGGPKVRAVVASTSEDVLADAIAGEAKTLEADRVRRAKDPHVRVKQEAIVDLGLAATPSDVAELASRLVDSSAGTAAAACIGLAQANAIDQLPFVLHALKAGRPEVTQACAFTVSILDPNHAADELAPLLKGADVPTASELLDRLAEVTLSSAARDAICHTALEHPDGATALRAATMLGAQCALPAATRPPTWSQMDQLRIETALARKDPELLKSARELLAGPDAELASVAAQYIGASGDEDDAALLLSQASAELHDMDFARAEIVQKADQKRLAASDARMKRDDQLRAMLGDEKFEQYQKLRPPLRDKLLARIKKAPLPEVADEFEKRPGEIDLISACIAGAGQLSADITGLAAVVFDEKELRLRLLALQLANTPPGSETVRALARKDADPLIRRAQYVYELQAGDPASVGPLASLMAGASPEERTEVAEILAPLVPKLTAASVLLISLTHSGDAAVASAAVALEQVRTPEAKAALLALLGDPKGQGSVAAIASLEDRQGGDVDAALAAAAVHPVATVREAALRALASRHACSSVGSLRALRGDYVGAVRAAAVALSTACPPPAPVDAGHP